MTALREQVKGLAELPDPGSMVLRAKLAGGTSWLLWLITAVACVVIAWLTGQIVARQRSIDNRLERMEDNQVLSGAGQQYSRATGE
jgi:cytochrome c-type biogenesis protein CcmH/NrfF